MIDGEPLAQAGIRTDASATVRRGLVFVFGFLGLFLLWAVLFPISSAVITPGRLVSAGQNKLIQHRGGGVVRSIEVQEGAALMKGDVILRLDQSEVKARLTQLEARHAHLSARKQRLLAEKNGTDLIGGHGQPLLRGSVLRGGDEVTQPVQALYEEQASELSHGRRRRDAEMLVARSRLDSIRSRLETNADRLANQEAALAMARRQLLKVRPLANEGHVAKVRLWELESGLLNEQSRMDELLGEGEVLKEQLSEAQAELDRLSSANSEKVSSDLTGVLAELAEIRDQIDAARNEVANSVVRAPVDGTLTGMTSHTVGGVVPSGQAIAEMVPTGAPLIAEVKVSPSDIDSVQVGQDARVAFTSYSRRSLDPVVGEVVYVSADSTQPAEQQEPFFVARIRFDRALLPEATQASLSTGMPVEAYIQSTPRVFLSYFLRPLLNNIGRSFREPN